MESGRGRGEPSSSNRLARTTLEEVAAERVAQFGYWAGWITHQAIAGDRLLGLLTATAGDYEAASKHFEAGLEFCRSAGYRPELGWTAANYAETLAQQASESDGDPDPALQRRIGELQDEAIEIATTLGMKPLVERVLGSREMLKA